MDINYIANLVVSGIAAGLFAAWLAYIGRYWFIGLTMAVPAAFALGVVLPDLVHAALAVAAWATILWWVYDEHGPLAVVAAFAGISVFGLIAAAVTVAVVVAAVLPFLVAAAIVFGRIATPF